MGFSFVKSRPGLWLRRVSMRLRSVRRLHPVVKGMLWSACAGLGFCLLNTLMRLLTLELDAFQVQFLRYFFGFVVMLPLVLRSGLLAYRPKKWGLQFGRGAIHTLGLFFWFTALPKIPLADMTAIGFTQPIFILLGAYFFIKEPLHWERWLAAGIGFVGILVVVGPKLSGAGGIYNLVMLASAPLFAISFLITKALTRDEKPSVIVVWLGLTVTLYSFPMAWLHWHNPTLLQWGQFMLCGLLGSLSHYCLARSYSVADISASQSVKFLDLVWASLLGYWIFSDQPSQSTLIGGMLIFASTVWIAQREARRSVQGIT